MFTILPIEQHVYNHNFSNIHDWDIEYTELDTNIGYWTGNHPFCTDDDFNIFKEIVSSYPIHQLNNNSTSYSPNPFATISTPPWVHEPFCQHIESFWTNFSEEFHPYKWREWGNVYFRGRCMPVDKWRIPHIDSAGGVVCNLWLDVDENATGTNLYHYKGTVENEKYDFMYDSNHKLYKEYCNVADNKRNPWSNFTKDEAEHWGFELLASIPAQTGKVTMYNTNIPHAPYITNSVTTRWSHAICIDY
jgi:hypothetical protein